MLTATQAERNHLARMQAKIEPQMLARPAITEKNTTYHNLYAQANK